ncbi:GNAT family N-acetyltransferase [Youngiibacter multivorans]|uniref:Ribosomal-protein-alanine N-acetyltransferase n=1 Tax=Youngiibacter multivorans TaxID=937251 RepID=A0ABS4G8H4_9CLOT|nr:GNAT family N-acetyltransferase [Youngiibacter multivorans]MBP1920865.1 ribosomal-protein-alanine N-acetyltransferase [Youngiibacter multivorans]
MGSGLSNNEFVETERLVLRQLEKRDSLDMLVLKSNKKTAEHTDNEAYTSIGQAETFIDYIIGGSQAGRWLYFVIEAKETREFIGTITLWNFNDNKTVAEVGYEMLERFEGHGYMSEALRTVLEIGFEELGLVRIEAFTSKENLQSIRLLEKNGFKKEKDVLDDVSRMPTRFVIMSLTSDERSDF